METSAANSSNIDEAFQLLIKNVRLFINLEIIINMKNKIISDQEKREMQKKIRINEDYNFTRDSVGRKSHNTTSGSSFCCG